MDFTNVCRLCTKEKLKLRNILGDKRHVQLVDQIRELLRIEIDENDGLPQKVCKPCAGTMQKIHETLDEFRQNDMRMRKQIMGLYEVEVKEEEIDESREGLGAYSLKTVKIEVLGPGYSASYLDDIQPTEEWLEDNGNDGEETNSVDEAELLVQKRKIQTKLKPKSEVEDEDSTAGGDTTVENITVKKKRIRKPRAEGEEGSPRKRRKKVLDANRPRLNDYKCYICKSEPLGSAKNLLDHLNTHTDQLPFTCVLCEQETVEIKQIRSLNLHLKMHEQPIKCQYCDRRYANDRARDYHVQSFHLGDNAPCPTPCDVCGKVCPSLLSLRTHMRRHTISYNCEYCGKGFSENSKLKRHITRVHEITAGYECKICLKRLNTIDAYELHIRTIHEGRRDFECEICGRRFTTAAFLRMHHKQYEGGVCKPKNNWMPYYTTRITEEGIKLYTCKVCKKEDMRSIAEHLRSHFPEEHECPVCLLRFSRKSTFDRHRLTHKEIVHSCFSCDKGFLSPKKLARHMANAHDIGQVMHLSPLPDVSDEELEFDVVE